MRNNSYLSHYSRGLSLAVPIVFSNLGHMLTALTDTLMIGQLGAGPLASASFATNIFAILQVAGIGLSLGVTPLASSALAKEQYSRLNGLFMSSLALYVSAAVLIAGVFNMAAPALNLLNQDPEVTNAAIPYFRLLITSLIPLMLFQASKQTVEGLSLTKVAMYVSVGANLINVGLNYLFIFGKLGIPAMGLNGAGLATILARIIMALVMLTYVLWPGLRHQYNLHLRPQAFSMTHIRDLFKLGMPISLQMLFEVSAFSGATLIVGLIGAKALAAHQIALTITSVTYMAANGLAAAATVTVSDFLSRGAYREARKAGFSMYHVNGLFMAGCGIMLVLLRDWLPTFFIDDAAVLQIAPVLLLFAAVFQLSDGFQVTGQSALRGLADVRIPTVITFLAYWVVGLPLGYWLGIVQQWGVAGVWTGLVAGLSTAAIMLTVRFHRKTRITDTAPVRAERPSFNT